MKYIFITGASSGIGKTTAIMLAQKGFHVLAGVRKEEDFNCLNNENSNITAVYIDVAYPNSVDEAYGRILEIIGDKGLYAIVNNAGIAVAGPLEFLPLDKLKLQLNVNVIGQLNVIQKMLPLIRKGQGRIVNISSVAGFSVFPFNGAYAVSKHSVEAFSDCLRRELSPWKIPVSIIEPGVIKTPIWEKSINLVRNTIGEMPQEAEQYYGAVYKNLEDKMMKRVKEKGTSPEEVAKAIIHAVTAKNPKTRYLVGKDACFLRHFLTKLPDKIIDKLFCSRVGLDKRKA